MQEQSTSTPAGSRLLFSSYDDGEDTSWTVRLLRDGSRPVVLCQSNRNTAAATMEIMRALFRDPVVEAHLRAILAQHGEP